MNTHHLGLTADYKNYTRNPQCKCVLCDHVCAHFSTNDMRENFNAYGYIVCFARVFAHLTKLDIY